MKFGTEIVTKSFISNTSFVKTGTMPVVPYLGQKRNLFLCFTYSLANMVETGDKISGNKVAKVAEFCRHQFSERCILLKGAKRFCPHLCIYVSVWE